MAFNRPRGSASRTVCPNSGLAGSVDEAQFKTSRGWIALGDSPRHFQWVFERGATLFVMWPCGLKQLTDAVHATEEMVLQHGWVVWPGDIGWNRDTAIIRKGPSRINLTPLESDIRNVLWERRMCYTSPPQIL